jgi:hypothetical protein
MAYALNVDIIEHRDGESMIPMSLTFWGDTEIEAELEWDKLKQRFEFFAAASREGRTIEELEEIDADELPNIDEDDDD